MWLAEVSRPTVILLDIGMPKLNGHEAARDIRAQPWGRNVTLIAVTAYGQKADKHRSKETGFDYHTVKPVGLAALEQLLADLHPSN
ncbi:MAG: response regulator [Pseudomonadota bacterium]|nr:response regulator [Pseudomonadota bacterium]